MKYEKDFVDEKPVEFDIEGRKFTYKPTTAGDENVWLKDIMEVDSTTKEARINFAEYNKKKLSNIMSVPYNSELISKILGSNTNAEWEALTVDLRYKLLSKLKPGIFDKIINAIKEVDSPDEKAVKN